MRVMILGLLILASGTIITYVTQYMTTYADSTLHVATDLAFATTVVSNGVGIVAALYAIGRVLLINCRPLLNYAVSEYKESSSLCQISMYLSNGAEL